MNAILFNLPIVFLSFCLIACGSENMEDTVDDPTTSTNDIYWGDLHSHTAYSDDATSYTSEGPQGAFAFARDIALLDFVAVADHVGYLTQDEWQDTRIQAEDFYDPGHFGYYPSLRS